MPVRHDQGPPESPAALVAAALPGGELAVSGFILAAGVFVAVWTVVLAIYARPVELTEDELTLEDC